ncbi:MAG: WhiB family transcriptional regulator [Acidimicrobiia bacterium]|nr:WhiB family transcriptional regulator [Acidimicrobiia bacterium]
MFENDTLVEIGREWRELAACAGREDDLFFPVNEAEKSFVNAAKAVCAGCPVKADCLAYAIETGQTEGIWGGLTSMERRMERRRWVAARRRAS